MSTNINQKEYLKKYLRIGKAPDLKKKKKEKNVGNRLKIIDDDVDVSISQEIEDDLTAANEDAPQIVAVIDERPPSLQVDEHTKSNLWEPIGKPSNTTRDIQTLKVNSFKLNKQLKSGDTYRSSFKLKQEQVISSYSKRKAYVREKNNSEKSNLAADLTPPQRSRDSDSPLRRHNREDISPPRKNSRKDQSPLRKSEIEKYSSRKQKRADSSSPQRDNEDSSPTRRVKGNSFTPKERRIDSNSPPRRNLEDDNSPPRRKDKYDNSPRRNNKQEDSSPAKRKYKDYDYSPPRRKNGNSPLRRENKEDNSPPRKIKREDNSPPRRKRDRHQKEDNSPPRRRKDRDSSTSTKKSKEHISPPRIKEKDSIKKRNVSRWNPENSPEHLEPMRKTLDGKKAGLQNAKDLSQETKYLKQKEDEAFKSMPAEVSGKDAATVVRAKKAKDLEEEAIKEKEQKKMKEKYDRWGKGLKQVEDRNKKIEDQLHEMSKPLARYADDEDLEKYLKEQERDDDPMLSYIRKKKKKDKISAGIPEKPMYMGEFMPNRFGIPPGHRWDGVDRSNGYEKKWFQVQNEKKSNQEEAFKWSMEDM